MYAKRSSLRVESKMNCLNKIFNMKTARVSRFVNQKGVNFRVSVNMMRKTSPVKLKENIEKIQTRNSPPIAIFF